MKRTLRIGGGAGIAAALVIFALVAGPGYHASNRAAAVTELTTIDQLKQQLKHDAGKLKLIALLSPV